MKFTVATILTALLAFISGLFFPWWGIAIGAFIVGIVVQQTTSKAFLAGSAGVLLLWSGLCWWINIQNAGVLAKKIASILPLGGSTFLLILITGIVGGLVAGFAAMSASYLRSPEKRR